MRYVICLLALISSISIKETLPAQNAPKSVYKAITALQPGLRPLEANRLAKALVKVSKRKDCGLPWKVLLSVAFNESSLRKSAIGRTTKSTDKGLMQISHNTALLYHLDEDRLLNDEEYNLTAGCRVLKDIKDRFNKKTPYWLGMYRSGTSLRNVKSLQSAKSYYRMVMRTVNKISLVGVL